MGPTDDTVSGNPDDAGETDGAAGTHRRAWLALAVVVFALATCDRYAAVLEGGLRETIPTRIATRRWGPQIRMDHRFVVWAVARNAHTLVTRPTHLFDAEQCFPDTNTLALGEPVIAMGVLGIPAWVVSGDPVLTYNTVLFLMSLCAALAMYWLIVEWTGVPAAGIVAGLLYAFQGQAIQDVVHPYSSDTTWLVLALLFAHRLFTRGRWRDAIGLAASASMQLATSFYSFVAAGLIGLPFVLWLTIRWRFEHARPTQLAAVAAALLTTGAIVFGPYVSLQEAGVLDRSFHIFRAWGDYLPGRPSFYGWAGLLLVAVGFVLPRRLSQARLASDARPALVAGGVLVAVVAAGPQGIFGLDAYAFLAAWAPGFDSVRIPFKISIGVHFVLSVLAGLGAAALVASWLPRGRWTVGAVGPTLVAIALALVTWGPINPAPPTFAVRPDEGAIRFFEELANNGNDGPIFETPIPEAANRFTWAATSEQLLLSAWHHRPTSACYPSHPQPSRGQIEALELRLPDPAALTELGRLGFTTIVLRHPPRRRARPHPLRSARGRRFHLLASRSDAPLRFLHESAWATAYEIGYDGR